MFVAALFIIATTWEQQKCPSLCERNDKLWCVQTIEYYLALKGNKLSSPEKTWRNLKCTLLSEISQSEKASL